MFTYTRRTFSTNNYAGPIEKIMRGERWKVGSMTGGPADPQRVGILALEHIDQYLRDVRGGYVRCVVRSYDTPIAWLRVVGDNHTWIVPDAKYSVTTTKHQSAVAGLINAYRQLHPHMFVQEVAV